MQHATVSQLAEGIGSAFPTANALVADLIANGVMQEVTGGRRDRIFAFKPYLDLLHMAVGDLTGVVGEEDRLVTGP